MTIPPRFHVVREVGEGGVGLVYEVADTKFSGVHRALKVPRPGLSSDPKARALFVMEVTAAASIKSDHVVQVLDYDVTGELPWMLMELLAGERLDVRVARTGRLPRDEARLYAAELGHALAAAHAAGTLHLDLKPANLFLAQLADVHHTTTLKVLDFGLARKIADGQSHAVASRAMGTLAWMPPEQGNRNAELRPASDVWSFGLVVFWMLTARCYWQSIDAQGEMADLSAFYAEFAAGATVSASERARARGFEGELPTGFDAWFFRCVAKDPGSRWRDAREASRSLDDVLGTKTSMSEVPRAAAALTVPAERPEVPAGLTEPVKVLFVPGAIPGASHQTVRVEEAKAPPKRSGWLTAAFGAVLALVLGIAITAWWTRPSNVNEQASVPSTSLAQDVVTPQPSPPAVAPGARASNTAPPTQGARCPPDMVLIAAGSFLMGSPGGEGDPDEHPQHLVRFERPFCLDRTEVSVAAYRACVTAGACEAPFELPPLLRTNVNYRYCNWWREGSEAYPMNCVNWRSSRTFCSWPGHSGGARRLPREAEWEYAARGSSGRRYPWGNEAPDPTRANLCGDDCIAYGREKMLPSVGWTGIPGWSDGFLGTAPVQSFPAGATPDGLLNMAGNVSEQTEDAFTIDSYQFHDESGMDTRPSPASGDDGVRRVTRGGEWLYTDLATVRAARRGRPLAIYSDEMIGIRCARDSL